MQFDNVRLLVTDFAKSFDFYTTTVGLAVAWGERSGNFASFRTGATPAVAIFRRELMQLAVDDLPAPGNGAMVVFKVDDVDAFHRDALARGGRFCNAPRDIADWGIRVVNLSDPDGNLLEFCADLPKQRWSEHLTTQDTQRTT